MSRIKRYLKEDIDVTDQRDTGDYTIDEPSKEDFLINNLLVALQDLNEANLYVYEPELREAKKLITDLLDKAEKAPF